MTIARVAKSSAYINGTRNSPPQKNRIRRQNTKTCVARVLRFIFQRSSKDSWFLPRTHSYTTHHSSKMQKKIALSCLILVIITFLTVSSPPVDAAPFTQQNYWNQLEEEDPEALLDIIARLRHSIMRNQELENNKRGLDLGLSRGFSGSQAAKHLMGLAAANYAGGPGRRRRSE